MSFLSGWERTLKFITLKDGSNLEILPTLTKSQLHIQSESKLVMNIDKTLLSPVVRMNELARRVGHTSFINPLSLSSFILQQLLLPGGLLLIPPNYAMNLSFIGNTGVGCFLAVFGGIRSPPI